MKQMIIILLLLFLFTIYNCSEKLKEGIIYEMEFIPAHTSTIFITSTIGKITTTIPITYYYPDSWCVKIKNVINDKLIKDTIYVSQEIYKTLDIGMWYTVTVNDKYEQKRIKEATE